MSFFCDFLNDKFLAIFDIEMTICPEGQMQGIGTCAIKNLALTFCPNPAYVITSK